jgi:hypothetical protein
MSVAIILPDLACHLAAFTLPAINALSHAAIEQPTIFYENPAAPAIPLWTPVFHVSGLWGYTHPIVATSLSTARHALACQGPPLRILYLMETEWVRPIGRWFKPFLDVYTNPRLAIVPASQELADTFERVWNRKTLPVVSEFDLPSIINVARGN